VKELEVYSDIMPRPKEIEMGQRRPKTRSPQIGSRRRATLLARFKRAVTPDAKKAFLKANEHAGGRIVNGVVSRPPRKK
jgi:hypothetical protein